MSKTRMIKSCLHLWCVFCSLALQPWNIAASGCPKPGTKDQGRTAIRFEATLPIIACVRQSDPDTKPGASLCLCFSIAIASETEPLTWNTVHLRACALKPFSLHFFNPSFGLTNLDGRLLRLPVDIVTILTLGHLARRKYS